MQTSGPLGFAPLLHQQFQFLAFHVSQEAQQGLYFRGGHLGQVHAGESGMMEVGSLSDESDNNIRKS